jgi:hypothetical protein
MTVLTPDVPQVELAIVEMTNTYRAKKGLSQVAINPQLTNAARAYAQYLARTGKFAHDADGRQVGERARTAGYPYCLIAENLALNQDSRGFETRQLALQMVEGWLNSPGHHRNIVAPHSTEIGVGVARASDKDPKFISVQLFGRPQSLAYKFQISNSTRETITYTFGDQTHEMKPSFAVSHTACEPAAVVFVRAGSGASAKAINARYEARDGQVYVVSPAPGGGIKVEIKARETVR